MPIKITATEPIAQGTAAAIAATSALGGWWAAASQVALELFGVPIQVVVAALTASFAAQTFRPLAGVLPTLGSGVLWAMVGSFGTHFAGVALGAWLGVTVPAGAHAGVAMIISGSAPFLAPVLARAGPAAVARWLRGLGKGGQP